MALFESRSAASAEADAGAKRARKRRSVDSVDDMRRRARHRLIGACILVLIAIVVFPLLFDTEPRPVPVNAQISVLGGDTAPALAQTTQVTALNSGDFQHSLGEDEEVVDTSSTAARATDTMPPRTTSTATTTGGGAPSAAARPAQTPAATTSVAAQSAAQASRAASAANNNTATNNTSGNRATETTTTAAATPAKPATNVTTTAAASTNAQRPAATAPAPVAAPAPVTPVAPVTPPPAPPVVTTPPPAQPPAAVRADEAARARALLEGKPVETVAAARSDEGRFIVQVGAFSDEAKVREIRQKLEGLGLKTYTQVVQTGAGRATRVRVGPFANRAEADKAAERVKTANLPAAIMSM